MAMAGLALAGCVRMAVGGDNFAAGQAAIECRYDDALTQAALAGQSGDPSRRLFAMYMQAVVYFDTGQGPKAKAVMESAQADPTLNPGGKLSVDQMVEQAAQLRAGVRARREKLTGSAECPAATPAAKG